MPAPDLMPAVILAGGLATRLGPVTARVPKALVEVAGRPFISHQLALLRHNGVRSVLLLVGHLGEQIQAYCGDGAAWDLAIDYSFDGPALLGTAGAIGHAIPRLPDRFFVMYGDSYLTCDFGAVERAFRASGRPGLMTVFRNEGRLEPSNIELNGGRIVQYSKSSRSASMRHVDYGLSAFARGVFERLPSGEPIDLARVYQALIAGGDLAAFEVSDRFYEIGSPEGLRDTEAYLRAAGAALPDQR